MTFKLIKAGVAAVALLAVPFAAQAADVPIKGPYYKGAPRSVVSYYNWTGFYAGINAGYGMGTSNWSLLPGTPIKPKGAMFGGTVGYNWQAGAIVYGVEGDFDWSGVKGSVACGRDWFSTAKPPAVGSPPSAAGSATPSTAGCPTSPPAAPTAMSKRPPACLFWAYRARWPRANSAGPSAPASNTPSWAIGRPSSNISTSISAVSTPASPPIVNNVSFKENIIRAGLNYKFSGPIFSRF